MDSWVNSKSLSTSMESPFYPFIYFFSTFVQKISVGEEEFYSLGPLGWSCYWKSVQSLLHCHFLWVFILIFYSKLRYLWSQWGLSHTKKAFKYLCLSDSNHSINICLINAYMPNQSYCFSIYASAVVLLYFQTV